MSRLRSVLDIADDGAEAAVEQAKGKVLVAEQPALFPRLRGDAEDAGAAQAIDAMSEADLIVLLAGIEREQDGDLLAFVEGLAGGLVGGDDEEFDLAEAELVVGVVEAEGEDFLDGIKDGLGDEGGAVGTLLDPATEQAVEGLGIEPSLAELILHEFQGNHARHLRRETRSCTPCRLLGFRSGCQVAQYGHSLSTLSRLGSINVFNQTLSPLSHIQRTFAAVQEIT